ncbi:MAG: hypothetical protein K6E62_06475, partial [Lachnospiraceae bacterium]|nr:hypothetical protein [Lachnospiraceae bacterium]
MNRKWMIAAAFLVALLLCVSSYSVKAFADENENLKAVEVGSTDYENLVMKLYPNDNSIIYLSLDNRKTWNEVEGTTGRDENDRAYIEMDISWASPSSSVKMYFKGNNVKTETSCTLPKQDSIKVKFDKVSGDFDITNSTDASTFWWKKATDSYWNEVPFSQSAQGYRDFLKTVETLRFKGAKLVFRTGQVAGKNAEDMGRRPSKEVNVSIPKFASAPTVKLNVVKLTLNTKATMEYTTDIGSGTWKSCEKNMGLDQVAPGVFLGGQGSANDVTVYFRVAQTEKKAASLISSITIPAQTTGPSAGEKGTDVKCGENSTSGKLDLVFEKASAANMFEYCVITPDKTFDLKSAKWKTVKTVKTVSLTRKAAPDDTVIYFRYKGTAENQKKNIMLKLPSEYTTYTVKWSPEPEKSTKKKN